MAKSPELPEETLDHAGPDWEFDTDTDLRSHAYDLVGSFSARLLELESSAERPVGTVVHAHLDVPCPDENNVTRQAEYVGHCAAACRDSGLVVRSFTVRETGGGHTVASLLVCSAETLTIAWAEQQADDNPERSGRIH